MKLTEIWNSTAPISWTQLDHQHRGIFEHRGQRYVIVIDKYETDDDKIIVDVGFAAIVNGRNDLSLRAESGNAASIYGIVINAL